jgi:branched-chain amino acid transport system permease protein
MENFLQQLINGVTLGSIYGLIAIGYTMVFGIIGMVNFAHGDVFMLSAFIALIIFLALTQLLGLTSLGLVFLIVLMGAMVLTALWNWVIERVAYRPLRGSFRLAPLISAIGMSIFLANFVQVVQGPRNKPVPPMFTDVIHVTSGGAFDVRGAGLCDAAHAAAGRCGRHNPKRCNHLQRPKECLDKKKRAC